MNSENPQLQIGNTAPDVLVLDERGEQVRLSELWAAKPLALFFMRHLG